MKFPLDLLPMALCGLATLVAVAVILVASDLLRRFVLMVIARVERGRAAAAEIPAPPPVADPDPAEPVSRSETLPG